MVTMKNDRLTVAARGLAVVVLLVTVLSGLTPSTVAEATPAELQQPHAKIVEPADGTTVPGAVTGRGTVSDLPPDLRLWTVVHIDGGFWPQRPAVVVGDRWTAAAFFADGAPEHRGKRFDLLVVAVDSDTHNAWAAYLEHGRATGDFPPLLAMPSGVTPLDQVTVVLQ